MSSVLEVTAYRVEQKNLFSNMKLKMKRYFIEVRSLKISVCSICIKVSLSTKMCWSIIDLVMVFGRQNVANN